METTKKAALLRLSGTIQALDKQMVADIQNVAADQAARAARLTTVRDRLTKKLGAANPRVADLTKSIDTSTAVAQDLRSKAQRMARRPAINPADLAVRGRVLDKNGAGVAKLSVRLSNQTGNLKIGPVVETDDTGDFTLVVKAAELPAPAPPLYLVVETDGGARVAMSTQAISLQAGHPLYVEIVESNKPQEKPAAEANPVAPKPEGSAPD